jgi:hypothetical protein
MMKIVTMILRRPWIIGLVGMAAVIGFQQYRVSSALTNLADCKIESVHQERELIAAKSSIRSLLAAVENQNRQILEYKRRMIERASAQDQAQKDAEDAMRRAQSEIDQLAASDGASCSEGIALVDRELGL